MPKVRVQPVHRLEAPRHGSRATWRASKLQGLVFGAACGQPERPLHRVSAFPSVRRCTLRAALLAGYSRHHEVPGRIQRAALPDVSRIWCFHIQRRHHHERAVPGLPRRHRQHNRHSRLRLLKPLVYFTGAWVSWAISCETRARLQMAMSSSEPTSRRAGSVVAQRPMYSVETPGEMACGTCTRAWKMPSR